MTFDINSARQAIEKGEVKIKKGEGITHALMRAVDAENASKGVKDLENEFRALDAVNRKAIMDLAKEVGNHVPFVGRTKNAKYDVTDKAQIGETLSISGSTPAPVPPTTPAPVPPTTPAPVPPTTPAPVPPKSPQEFYDEKLKQADTYLKKNGYSKNNDGNYENKDKDLTIKIDGTEVDFERSASRLFSWGLNNAEKAHVAEVRTMLKRQRVK